MPEENEKLAEQVKSLRKDMDELRDKIEKNEPLAQLEERVENIEEINPAAFALDPFTPDLSRSGDLPDTRRMPASQEEGFTVLPFDIEFGKPTANVTTDVDKVTLQPCDQGGTSFANADTVTNYVANDRQTQDTSARGWTTSTILSFIRFSPFVAGSPNIEGVLIGEDKYVGPPQDQYSIKPFAVGFCFDCQNNHGQADVDTTHDYGNSILHIVAYYNTGAPSPSSSMAQSGVSFFNETEGEENQVDAHAADYPHIGTTYVRGSTETQILGADAGFPFGELKLYVDSDGNLEAEVIYESQRFYVYVYILCSGSLPDDNPIVLDVPPDPP